MQLNPKEVKIMQMALEMTIEDLESTLKNPAVPLNGEARKMSKEMLGFAKSAREKLIATTGHTVKIDPYVEGDENEFITKPS